jgi:hypothetical protein
VWDRKRFRIDHTPDITIRLMRYLTLIVNNVLIGLMRGRDGKFDLFEFET